MFSKKTSGPSNVPDYEFMFANPEDAKQALRTIKATIKMYDVATIADLKAAIGFESDHTDTKYGWISSDKMAVRMMDIQKPSAGYLLYLPKPYPIGSDGELNVYTEATFPPVKFKPALTKAAKDDKIQKAYNVLTKAYCDGHADTDDLSDAMQEAIGYLGEVLK